VLCQKIKKNVPFIVIDYDKLKDNIREELSRVLKFLEHDMSSQEMMSCIEGEYEPNLNHQQAKVDLDILPSDVRQLYEKLLLLAKD